MSHNSSIICKEQIPDEKSLGILDLTFSRVRPVKDFFSLRIWVGCVYQKNIYSLLTCLHETD